MLKIGVISDTHICDLAPGIRLADRLCATWFADVETILHAGDVVDSEFLNCFGARTIHAVRGNMDPPVAGIPIKKIITVAGFRIGLVHGWGAPDSLEQRLLHEFQGVSLDCLVYGHSHRPVCHRVGNLLVLNPGSATDRREASCHTIGILEISDRIEGSIIALD